MSLGTFVLRRYVKERVGQGRAGVWGTAKGESRGWVLWWAIERPFSHPLHKGTLSHL